MLIPFKKRNTACSREEGFVKAAYKRTVPFAISVLLLLIAGYIYICRFGKGSVYAFCYTVLPVLMGLFDFWVFRKIDILQSIDASSEKSKALFLAFFAAHILLMGVLGDTSDFAPEMMLLSIPAVYSLYVSVIPYNKGMLKAIACALFWAGALVLTILRPTSYAGDGLFCIHVSLFLITLFAIKNDCFGYDKKGMRYFLAAACFAASHFILTCVTYITPFFSTITNFADISTVSASEVIQNIGTLPALLLCAVYLAVTVFGFILASGKDHAMKYITIGVTASFALVSLLNVLTAANALSTNFGLPLLECTELSTCFTLLFALIIFEPNKDDLRVHSFVDSVLYESIYTGKFADKSYSKGRLLIVQGPTGSGKTNYLKELMEDEPGNALYFTMETVYERLVRRIHDGSLLANATPELIFPEILETSISLILIDDVDTKISGKPTTQKVLGHLLNLLMIDWGIGIAIAGMDLEERVPELWDELTNCNNERFCGAVTYVEV